MKDLIPLFTRDLERLKKEIQQYPSDESLWLVKDGINNSAGNLCAHLCGNLRHFVGKNLANDGYVRDREKEFSVKGLSRETLVQEIDETNAAVTAALEKLDEAALNDPYPDDKPFPNSTTKTILLHLYAHLSYHLGQINYHRRLLT